MYDVGSQVRKGMLDPLAEGLDWRRPEMAGEAVGSNVVKEDTQKRCSHRSAPDCSIGSLLASSRLKKSGADLWE